MELMKRRRMIKPATAEVSVKAEAGKLTHIVRYPTGTSVEIPLNQDGTVKWFPDIMKKG